MDTYEANQNRIYENDFRAVMETLTGVQASDCMVKPSAGYIVAWLYPESVMQVVENMNGRVHGTVPTISFDRHNAHTTITVYQKQSQAGFTPHKPTLQALAAACNSLDWQLLRTVRIDFQEWLFNREAVIAAGRPNAAFWRVGEALQAAGRAYGLDLRMPWGAHMTVARFLRSSDNVAGLLRLMRGTAVLGPTRPGAIVVGHYTCGPAAFHLVPFEVRTLALAE